MLIELVDSLRDLDGDAVDNLDAGCMVTGCWARLVQLESDRLWNADYIVAYDGPTLCAVVPIYTSRAAAWSEVSLDPQSWAHPACAPADAVLVGAIRSVHSPLRVAPDDGLLTEVFAAVRSYAADRTILLPHYGDAAVSRLVRAFPDATWHPTEAHSDIVGVDERWESRLSSRVRQEIRHDRRMVADAGVSARWLTWDEVTDEHLALLVAHAAGFGQPGHVALTRRHYAQWRACPGVEPLLCVLEAGGAVLGVASALRWRDEIVMYEVGLAGARSAARLAAYTMLLGAAPVAYALDTGLTTVHLGYTNDFMKVRRGAVADRHHYGVVASPGTARDKEEAPGA